MKRIYLSFPKSEGFFSKLIKFRTLSNVYHVEFVLEEEGEIPNFYLVNASAKKGRVIAEQIVNIDKYVDSHEFVLIPLNSYHRQMVVKFLSTIIGQPYDFLGVVEISINKESTQSKAWYCSELCTAALQHAGVLLDLDAKKISPGELKTAVTSFVDGYNYRAHKYIPEEGPLTEDEILEEVKRRRAGE